MGVFGAIGAIRAVERLKSGRSQSEMLSIADIAMTTVNMSDAQRNLPQDQYIEVQALFNELQKKKEKKKYTIDEYMDQWTVMTFLFDSYAPFELYCGSAEIAASMRRMKDDLSYCEMRDMILEHPELIGLMREAAEDIERDGDGENNTDEPVNVFNDRYSEDSEEDISDIEDDEQPLDDNDYLEDLYDLSVEESNKAVYKAIPGDIQGALHFAIFKVLAGYYSNSGTPWLCDYLSSHGLSDSQIQNFLNGYESMFVAEEMGAYDDIEWDLQETDELDLTLMYKAVATLSHSATTMEVAERLQKYLSPEELEYLLTDYDPDDPLEAAIYELFMFYDMQFIEHGDTTDEDDDYSQEDTEPLDDEIESLEINEESAVSESGQQQVDVAGINYERQSRYNLTEILKAGEYSDTDYQKVFFCLRQSDKYKDKIEEFFTGVYVTGDMDEILSELETIMSEKEAEEAASQKVGVHDAIPVEALRALKLLYDEGILTDQEFSEKKRNLLNL